MTNQDILAAAMAQSAVDLHCRPEDFSSRDNRVVLSRPDPRARRYLELPFVCNMVSYGNNVVASAGEEYADLVRDYLLHCPAEHAFETPAIHLLDDAFRPYGMRTCFMAEYFLPDLAALNAQPCLYETRLMGPTDFAGLYVPAWSNALCEKRKELDVLGVGAYQGETLVGLAACSADCDGMWQIGVDVLPGCRRQGIASALTTRLALEILERGKVPFYCAAWCNIRSVRNAVRSGFRPAWAELTVKSSAFVDRMNRDGH